MCGIISKNKSFKPILRIAFGILATSAFFISPEFCRIYHDLCKAWEFLIHFDKVFHFMFFTGLAFYIPRHRRLFINIFVFLGLIIFGATIEIIQYFIPNRGASAHDFAADVLGVFFGTMLRPKKINKTKELKNEPHQ